MQSKQRTNYRQKGTIIKGKVYKGFIQEASSKITVGSIPSKFETIIFKNNNQKAFGSSTNRFFKQEEEIPGPGEYAVENKTQEIISISTQENSQQAYPKKIPQTAFSSTTIRNTFGLKYMNSGPGPGSYEQKEKNELLESRVQNQKGSSMFLAKSRESQSQDLPRVKIETPGPGDYNPKELTKNFNPYHSSFLSLTIRDKYLGKSDAPPIGIYNIRKNIDKLKPYEHKGYMSSFCNPTEVKNSQTHLKNLVKYLDDDRKQMSIAGGVPIQIEKKQVPGPGHYSQDIPEFKPDYLILENNHVFKSGLKDRFGDFYDKQRDKQAFPGPQAYNVEQVIGIENKTKEKALVSGSAFISESLRKPYGEFDKKLGPSQVTPPIIPQKKSFHLNLSKKWC